METKDNAEVKLRNDAFETSQGFLHVAVRTEIPYKTTGIEFKTEMDAITKKSDPANVLVLLQKRPRCTHEYLDELLDYCLYYQGENKDEEMLRLDYAVSRLVGVNIYSLRANEKQWATYLAHLKEIALGLKERGMRSLRLIFELRDMDEIKNKIETEGEIIILKAQDKFTIFYKDKRRNCTETSYCSKNLEKYIFSLKFNGEILVKDQNSKKIYDLVYKEVTLLEGYTEKREKKDYAELEGWHEKDFLPHRIRALFIMLYELKSGSSEKHIADVKDLKETINILRKEIFIELETLYICRAIEKIKLFDKTDKENKKDEKVKHSRCLYPEMIEALAKDIYLRVTDYFKQGGQEYVLSCGWPGHAIYLSIVQNESKSLIRIDNLGDEIEGNHHEVQISGILHYYPRYVFVKDLAKNLKLYIKEYIEICIDVIVKEDIYGKEENKIRKKALAKLYAGEQLNLKKTEELAYRPSPEQKGGTCVVTSHNVGLKIRMGAMYEWVLEEELKILVARSPKLVFDEIIFNKFEKEFSEPFPLLPSNVLENLKQHCIQKAKIELLFGKREFPANKFPVVLTYSIREGKEKSSEPILKSAKKIIHGNGGKRADETIAIRKISSFKLLDFFDKNNMQILVKGDAGMGKSTLCKFVMLKCVTHKEYIEKFPLVLPISLRNLNAKNYPQKDSPYTVFDIVFRECFYDSELSAWEKEKLKKALNDQFFLERCLWVLDGGDELSNTEHLGSIIEELLNMPKRLLTSRFDNFQRRRNHTLIFDIEGFNTFVLRNYIKYFFSSEKTLKRSAEKKENATTIIEDHERLYGLLESHPNILEIACIPINLELICSIWEYDSNLLAKVTFSTTTKLYTQITTWLMRRFLKEKEATKDEVLKDESRVSRRLKEEIDIIEKIAFHMMRQRTTILSYKEVSDVVPEICYEELCKDVVGIGVFQNVSSNEGDIIFPSNFEFIHKSFQEFFAAGYLARNICSFDPKTNSEIVNFIEHGRYDRFNNLFFRFSAGRLAHSSTLPESQEKFWRLIACRSQSFNEMNYLVLLLDCLQECNYKIMLQRFPEIDQYLVDYLPSMWTSPFFEKRHLEAVIKRSGNVLAYSQVLHPLLTILSDSFSCSSVNSSGCDSIAYSFINKSDSYSQAVFSKIIITHMQNSMQIQNLEPSQKKLTDYLVHAGQGLSIVKDFILELINSDLEKNQIFGLHFLSLQHQTGSDTDVTHILIKILDNKCSDVLKKGFLETLEKSRIYNENVLAALKEFSSKENNEDIKGRVEKILASTISAADFWGWGSDDDKKPDDYGTNDEKFQPLSSSSAEQWLLRQKEPFGRDRSTILDKIIKKDNHERSISIDGEHWQGKEDVYQEYLIRTHNDYEMNSELLKKLTWAEWQYLLTESLYLEKTSMVTLLAFFLSSRNSLVGEMIFKRVLKEDINILLTTEGFLICENGNVLIKFEDPHVQAVSIDFFKNFIINHMEKYNVPNKLAWKEYKDRFKLLSMPAYANPYVLPKIRMNYNFDCISGENSIFDIMLTGARQAYNHFPRHLNALSLRKKVSEVLQKEEKTYFNKVLANIKELVEGRLKNSVFPGVFREFVKLLIPVVENVRLDYTRNIEIANRLKTLRDNAVFWQAVEPHWKKSFAEVLENKELQEECNLQKLKELQELKQFQEGYESYRLKELQELQELEELEKVHGEHMQKTLEFFLKNGGYQAYCENILHTRSCTFSLETGILAKLLKVRVEVYGDPNAMSQSKLFKDEKENYEFTSHSYSENSEVRSVIFIRAFSLCSYVLLNPTQLENDSSFFSDDFMPLLRRQYFLNQPYFQSIRNTLLHLRQRYQEQIQNVKKTVKHLNEPLKESATLALVGYEPYDQHQFQLLTIRQKYQLLVNNPLDGQLLVKGALLFKYARLPSPATSLVMEYCAEEGNLNELLSRTGRDFELS